MGDFNVLITDITEYLQRNFKKITVEKVKVSVIVPAYNVEGYIYDCLKSIITQSLSDIEIIVINDGSTDGTASIISVFEQYDERIKFINQTNSGVGVARNNALKFVSGEVVVFVDGDDKLDENALENLYNAYLKTEAEIIIFGAKNLINRKYYHSGYGVENIPRKLKGKILNSALIQSNLFEFPAPSWSKMYRMNFLKNNNILFQENRVGEDQLFFVSSMLLAKSCYVLDENLYLYRRNRQNSLTYKKLKTDNSPIMNFYSIKKFLENGDFSDALRFKVLDKYFIKAVSWLGKCDKTYRKTYYSDLIELIDYLSKKYPNTYWRKVNFKQGTPYWLLKFEIYRRRI